MQNVSPETLVNATGVLLSDEVSSSVNTQENK